MSDLCVGIKDESGMSLAVAYFDECSLPRVGDLLRLHKDPVRYVVTACERDAHYRTLATLWVDAALGLTEEGTE